MSLDDTNYYKKELDPLPNNDRRPSFSVYQELKQGLEDLRKFNKYIEQLKNLES